MTPSFVEPPSDLTSFPTLEVDSELWRIHDEANHPDYFGSSGEFRFDLLDVPGKGTCYMSSTPAGAFVEVFGDMRIVPSELLRRKRISRASVRGKLRVANVTDSHVLGQFGLGQEMSANLDYAPTQRWAKAFYTSGFDGIWYSARHDPTGLNRSVAVFGTAPSDLDRFRWELTQPIDEAIVEEVAETFGIEVLPTPS
jgi:hypothetical protein